MHCRTLSYDYDPEEGVCRFEDGTVYTAREMVYIAKCDLSAEDEDAIHCVKRVTGGELDTSNPPPIPPDWLSEMSRQFRPAKRVRISGPLPPLQTELPL